MYRKKRPLDVQNIKFSNMRPMGNFGHFVTVKCKGKSVVFQTPKLKLPYDVSNFKDKYSLDVSFSGMDLKNDECQMANFYQKLQNLDAKMVQVVEKKMWTKNQKHTPLLKKHKKFPATFKVKLPSKNNEFLFNVFDQKGEEIAVTPKNIEDVFPKGADVRLIVECTCLWITDNKFGLSFKVMQAQVFRRTNFKTLYFVDDSDDEFDFDV